MHEVFEKLFDMPIYVNSSCDQNEVKWCALSEVMFMYSAPLIVMYKLYPHIMYY